MKSEWENRHPYEFEAQYPAGTPVKPWHSVRGHPVDGELARSTAPSLPAVGPAVRLLSVRMCHGCRPTQMFPVSAALSPSFCDLLRR